MHFADKRYHRSLFGPFWSLCVLAMGIAGCAASSSTEMAGKSYDGKIVLELDNTLNGTWTSSETFTAQTTLDVDATTDSERLLISLAPMLQANWQWCSHIPMLLDDDALVLETRTECKYTWITTMFPLWEQTLVISGASAHTTDDSTIHLSLSGTRTMRQHGTETQVQSYTATFDGVPVPRP